MAKLSEMTVEDWIKAIVGAVFLVPVLVFGLAMAIGSHEADKAKASRDAEMAAATAAGDPARFARAFAPVVEAKFEPARNPRTGLDDRLSSLKVTVKMEPEGTKWLARGNFEQRVVELVPAVFSRFPTLDYIDIRGVSRTVDIRGHERVEEVAMVGFGRRFGDDINWPNVKPANVYKLANKSFLHSSLRD